MSHSNFVKYGHSIFDRPDMIICLFNSIWSQQYDLSMKQFQCCRTLALHKSWKSKPNLVATHLPTKFSSFMLAWNLLSLFDNSNFCIFHSALLEGGALLAVSAVRPSLLPAALWPPNNWPLSSLWALLPAQELLPGFVTTLGWKSQTWWCL